MKYHFCPAPLALLFVFVSISHAEGTALTVGSYLQEVHVPYTAEDGLPAGAVKAIAISASGTVYAGTDEGLARFSDGQWIRIDGIGAISHIALWEETLFAVSGDVTYCREGDKFSRVAETSGGVGALEAVTGNLGVWIGISAGLVRALGLPVEPMGRLNSVMGEGANVRGIATYQDELAVAAESGLFAGTLESWSSVYPQDGVDRWAPMDVRAVAYDSQGQLWFAAPQGVGCRHGDSTWSLYTGADGLPYNDFTCMAAGADGSVWFGTTRGAIQFKNGVWGYRQGRRWLLDDEVRDIAVAPNGDAWIATAKGVSRIEARPMTLSEKAAFYESEIDRYHKRTPYGYVLNAGLKEPGDKASAQVSATDNDGQYTGLYAGAECLAYGATRDPEFKKRATAAFEALAFLSEVTQGGEHPAPPGFVARAIMPTDGPNPNDHNTPERDREKQQGDKLWKVIVPRWPTSADGKWYWKSDTSSDELDGHFFAYALYFDHVAETDAEKARVREVVRRVTDHLIDHDFQLVDHDGLPTRWARFGPQDLNKDPDWWAGRGLNSMSILAYLSIAHHVTGDAKYRDSYMMLVREHDYAMNATMAPKLQSGPGSFVQFDDKMAFMNYYHLIQYETDPVLLRMWYTSIFYYWNIEKYEMNPFFNFVYAANCVGKIRTDQWGDLDMTPVWPWLEQSVDTLKRYPVDLVDWKCTNSGRIDLLPLPDHVREPGENQGTGYRVNGLVLPIDERQSLSWSEDVWELDTGSGGRRLRDGAPFLLAYYMGLYHGFIQ
ncbi:MAG: hypothetical protein AMXMBFR84_19130 [Candidatus Hydrogenedentota bacterium]